MSHLDPLGIPYGWEPPEGPEPHGGWRRKWQAEAEPESAELPSPAALAWARITRRESA